MLYFLLFLILISLTIISILSYKLKKSYKNNLKKEKEKINKKIEDEINNLNKLKKEKDIILKEIEITVNQKEKLENYINQDIEKLKEEKMKSLDYLLSCQKVEKETTLEKEFNKRISELENKFKERNEELETLTADKENEFYQKLNEFSEKSLKCANQYELFSKELNDIQSRVDASQNELIRRLKIQQQKDFYRICLSDDTIEDLKVLETIRPSLKNQSLFNKFIYDNYINAPAREMVKRVLHGKAPCGIYKITAPDGRGYIGKSTNVKDRWIGHIKTAYDVGTISHSTLHTELKKCGIENFTWELLEEVPKENLSEREKYWINFYKTTEVGLNQRKG